MGLLSKLFLIAYCLIAFQKTRAQVSNPLPKAEHRFIIVAHRGDHTNAPENTLAAFENAIQDGADYIEIDLRTTLDSQLVIMHDVSVDRMTEGKGFVKDMALETIRKLKVKDKVHPAWGEFEIPLFKEVLRLSKGKINIYLDFKNADPAAAYKEILEYGMEKHVVVYINEEQQLYGWRRAAPAMPLMVSLPDNVKDTFTMKSFLNKMQVEILDGDNEQYTNEMVTFAGKMGHLVLPDIQGSNESGALWEGAIQKGIRALQTDHPKELIKYLIANRLR
jgi:glycerophosphoryl diester phosphodiesterase